MCLFLNFDQNLSFGHYKWYATVFTLVGFGIANLGLNTVIAFSVPVLTLLYPIVIVLVLIILLNKWLALSKKGMSLTIALVTIVSLLEVLSGLIALPLLTRLVTVLPFHSISMSWLLPTMLGLALALLLPDKQKGEAFDLSQFEKAQ